MSRLPVPAGAAGGGGGGGTQAVADVEGMGGFLGKYTVPLMVIMVLAAAAYFFVYVYQGGKKKRSKKGDDDDDDDGDGVDTEEADAELGEYVVARARRMFLSMGCKAKGKNKTDIVCPSAIPAGNLGKKFTVYKGARAVVAHTTKQIAGNHAEQQQQQQQDQQRGPPAGAVVDDYTGQYGGAMPQPAIPSDGGSMFPQAQPQPQQQPQAPQSAPSGGIADAGGGGGGGADAATSPFDAPMLPEDYAMYGINPDGSPNGSGGGGGS